MPPPGAILESRDNIGRALTSEPPSLQRNQSQRFAYPTAEEEGKRLAFALHRFPYYYLDGKPGVDGRYVKVKKQAVFYGLEKVAEEKRRKRGAIEKMVSRMRSRKTHDTSPSTRERSAVSTHTCR